MPAAEATTSMSAPGPSKNGTNGVATTTEGKQKKRRIPGACDICKRKKIRCDSGEMPDNRCSNCTQFGLDCTHKEVTKTLGSAKGYVEGLEARLEKMDKLLSRLLPGVDVTQEVDRLETLEAFDLQPPPRNDIPLPTEMLTIQLDRLNLNPQQNRFFGKSSGYQLVQTALDLKQEYTGDKPKSAKKPSAKLKRHEFWDVPPWVSSNPELETDVPDYSYPPEDLMPSLIDAYFVQVNPFLPLLHRPTFEKSINEGLHFKDRMFGSTVLLVCAHGARHSDDPRVLADGFDSPRSAGWKWFEQVKILRRNLYKRTTLHELQMHALHVLFAQSSETPQGIWAQVGFAVRLMQEVGAHRLRRKKDEPPSIEDELWKRAFWVIMSLDRYLSSHSGRPCGLHDEDHDVDLPLECDDEYWESDFAQPEGKPSTISYFVSYLKLMDILAYAMRLIYPIKRPSGVFGKATPRSEQQIIAELDSAMNNWMDSVPAHLKWNPNRKDELFLKQSAALHATYYSLQIFIHRPFIPSPRNPTPVVFPSLAICTNAARSCCHVLESFTKFTAPPLAALQNTAFISAVILLLNIWSGKRSGYAPNPKREMEDVQRCMEILKACEKRWATAGRFRDILTELAFAGDVSIPSGSPKMQNTTSKKRGRDREEEKPSIERPTSGGPSTSSPTSPTSPSASSEQRTIAGTRRVSMSAARPSLQQASTSAAATTSPSSPISPLQQGPGFSQPMIPPLNFSLPMYGNQLGRLPIYGQFNFLDSASPASSQPLPHAPTPTLPQLPALPQTLTPAQLRGLEQLLIAATHTTPQTPVQAQVQAQAAAIAATIMANVGRGTISVGRVSSGQTTATPAGVTVDPSGHASTMNGLMSNPHQNPSAATAGPASTTNGLGRAYTPPLDAYIVDALFNYQNRLSVAAMSAGFGGHGSMGIGNGFPVLPVQQQPQNIVINGSSSTGPSDSRVEGTSPSDSPLSSTSSPSSQGPSSSENEDLDPTSSTSTSMEGVESHSISQDAFAAGGALDGNDINPSLLAASLPSSSDYASLLSANFNSTPLESFEDLSRLGIGTTPMPVEVMESDMMMMWSAAPTSFEMEDWNRYISNVEQMTQGQQTGGSGAADVSQ